MTRVKYVHTVYKRAQEDKGFKKTNFYIIIGRYNNMIQRTIKTYNMA